MLSGGGGCCCSAAAAGGDEAAAAVGVMSWTIRIDAKHKFFLAVFVLDKNMSRPARGHEVLSVRKRYVIAVEFYAEA